MKYIRTTSRISLSEKSSSGTPDAGMLEKKYYHLFNSMYDAVLITDKNGRISEANSRVFHLFQREPQSLIGANILELISGASEDLMDLIRATSEKMRSTAIDATCLRQDGSTFFAGIIVNCLDDDDKKSLCFFIRDMTQRRQEEEQIKNANEMMIKAEKTQARIDTISTLLDVLNNPLQILTLIAEIEGNADMKCQLDRINAVLTQLGCREELDEVIGDDGVSRYQLALPEPSLKPAEAGRVLICDDEKSICEALSLSLRQVFPHLTLDSAENGQEAIDKFAMHHHALVITDLNMPVKSGIAAYREIAAHCERNAWALPPFVFCTGFLIGDEIKDIVGDGGFHAYVKKPFALGPFMDLISRKLQIPAADMT
jgi:PAS domain S-box-containing protein